MNTGERWCPVPVDDEHAADGNGGARRYLVYGSRLGRLYMLPGERVFDVSLQRMLGLSPCAMTEQLHDPVQRIAYDEAGLTAQPRGGVSLAMGAAYRAFHRSRCWMPLRSAAALVRRATRRRRAPPPSVTVDDLLDVARLLRDLEHRVGFADCYPRALLTAYLCLLAGRDCVLTIGVLAPTRKMHAWCSVQGLLPYEPVPEHYLYRPLWSKTLLS